MNEKLSHSYISIGYIPNPLWYSQAAFLPTAVEKNWKTEELSNCKRYLPDFWDKYVSSRDNLIYQVSEEERRRINPFNQLRVIVTGNVRLSGRSVVDPEMLHESLSYAAKQLHTYDAVGLSVCPIWDEQIDESYKQWKVIARVNQMLTKWALEPPPGYAGRSLYVATKSWKEKQDSDQSQKPLTVLELDT